MSDCSFDLRIISFALNYRVWSRDKRKKAIFYTERKTGECFQRKTIGYCSRRDTCSFQHTHATGDRETTREEVEDARRSRPEQASSSVPKVKEQTDVKSSNSLEASPATKVKNPLSMVVTSLETDAFIAIVAYFDKLMVRRNPAREVEKRRYSRSNCYSEVIKRSKVVYLKTQIQ